MCGKLFALSSLVLLVACAQPKYVRLDEEQGSPNSQEFGAATCSLRFSQSQNCLSWFWEKKPTQTESGRLVFKIYRANSFDGSAVLIDPSFSPSVLLWMPGMGHGSSPTSTSRLDIGTFRTSDVFFIMPGEWEIKFQIKNENNVQDEIIVRVQI